MSGSLWRANLRAIRTETPRFSAQGQGGKDIITRQLVAVLLRSRKPVASYLLNLFDVWVIVFLTALVRPHSFLGFIKSDNLEHKVGPFHDLENTGLLPWLIRGHAYKVAYEVLRKHSAFIHSLCLRCCGRGSVNFTPSLYWFVTNKLL